MPRPIPGAGWAELVLLWEGFFAGQLLCVLEQALLGSVERRLGRPQEGEGTSWTSVEGK